MKNLFGWGCLTLLLVSCLFASCKDENDDGNTENPNYVFKVADEYKALACSAKGKVFLLDITSSKNDSKVNFEVESSPKWAPAVIEMTGLTVTVQENTSKEPRETGKIVLVQDETGAKLEITVNQDGVASSLKLEASYVTNRCKVLTIEPDIAGYAEAPVYTWKCKKEGTEDEAKVIGTAKNLPFIQLEQGVYILSLEVKDGNTGETQQTKVTVNKEITAYSAFISQVYEYLPAPGINVSIAPNVTKEIARKTAEDVLKGRNVDNNNSLDVISLGGLGGNITFAFDHTVVNVPGKRDFRVNTRLAGVSAFVPSIVWVAFDKNGNGKPDADEWYEIAGSEYLNVNAKKNITMTYTVSTDEPIVYKWKNSKGEEGTIDKNDYPMVGTWGWARWVGLDTPFSFTGITQLPDNVEFSGTFPSVYNQYAYGYANNSNLNTEAGRKMAAIDISWAVDKDGNKVNLPGVDFVKVYHANFQDLSMYYGYTYTLISGATDCHLKGENFDSDVTLK